MSTQRSVAKGRAGAFYSGASLWVSLGVLLVAARALFLHADDLSMWFDELWTLFHVSGSFRQIFTDRDLSWPPGWYVLLYAWIHVFSRNDFVVHLLSVYLGMLSVAATVRVGRELHSRAAGWLAGLALGTSGYAVYFMIEVRGYALVLFGALLVLLAHVFWWRRPTWWRTVAYALAQIALFYTHFMVAPLVSSLLGARVVLAEHERRRQYLGRWLLVMGVSGLSFVPLVPQFLRASEVRTAALEHGVSSAFIHTPRIFYQAYGTHRDVVFGLVLALTVIGLARAARRRALWGTLIALGVWSVAVLLFAYFTRERLGLFNLRYLAFVLPAAFLLIGIGLAQWEERVRWGSVALLAWIALAPWHPFDMRPRYSDDLPVRDLMRALAERFGPDDVLVIDPNFGESLRWGWWYYEPLYFPRGPVPIAPNGTDAGPRVWHLVRQGNVDEQVLHTVETGRIFTEFWGPWYFIASLYEGPPLAEGVLLEGSVRYRGGALTTGTLYRPGDTLTAQTWWDVNAQPSRDYSLGLYVVDASGRTVAQTDGGPRGPYAGERTAAWLPERVYRDERRVQLPEDLPPGDYAVRVAIYRWEDGERLCPVPPVASASPLTWQDCAVELARVNVASFDDH